MFNAPAPGTLPVSKALAFVNSHGGIFGFETVDGFVVKSEAVYSPELSPNGETDRVVETFEVFPVYDGRVNLRALRDYLGY